MEKSPLEFYNDFVEKLLKDFVLSNPRTEQAIMSGMKMIDFSNKDVLDIGCGIGWSSYEFSKRAHSVIGIDLSDKLISVAGGLFEKENLEFKQLDVTEAEIDLGKAFDVVTLLDVFEHIPDLERNKFIKSINKALKSSGLVYLSCPSVYHQAWLRKEQPEGLQPVDEDIDLKILTDFASKLDGGDVMYFSYKSIWRANDYFHAVIQKGPVTFPLSNKEYKLDKSSLRYQRVKALNEKLQIFSSEEMEKLNSRRRKVQRRDFKKKIKDLLRLK